VPTDTATTDLVDELSDWVAANWATDLTVAEWWDRLGRAGWAAPMLPVDAFGRGLSQAEALVVRETLAELGTIGAPVGLGLLLAAPTIAAHGTPEQVERFVPDIVTGRAGWCQLFSEPGAGSDLAGLTTRAEPDGEEWVVRGQKVWTSGGQFADMGMLLARTNVDVPKHRGITWFAFPMHQDGVEVRPLREMTGATRFSEVFFTEARVADDARIGARDDGWRVANTTLTFERQGMGAGGAQPARGAGIAVPGTVARHLERPVADFLAGGRRQRAASGRRASPAQFHIDLARAHGRDRDPLVRQRLAQLHVLGELCRLNAERHRAVRAGGGDVPGMGNLSKLVMADSLRLGRDLDLELLGARGMLHAYDGEDDGALGSGGGRGAQEATARALGAQALPIFGGTDQIQRNILGERALGLAKEPGDLSGVPFSELPRNA
jgi:alkylation response protein AidB-like acyl-CoA dehydrogenase